MILMCNKSKIYVKKRRFARDTILRKCDCLFDALALFEDNAWVLQIWEVKYNKESIFSSVYFIYKKVAITQDV